MGREEVLTLGILGTLDTLDTSLFNLKALNSYYIYSKKNKFDYVTENDSNIAG